MNKKLEELFNKAPLEFWMQLDDGIRERIQGEVLDYLKHIEEEPKNIASLVKLYQKWIEAK